MIELLISRGSLMMAFLLTFKFVAEADKTDNDLLRKMESKTGTVTLYQTHIKALTKHKPDKEEIVAKLSKFAEDEVPEALKVGYKTLSLVK